MHRPSRRVALAAVALITGLPLAAYGFAPVPATADAPPASGLAGLNTTSIATAVHVEVRAPGIVPLGDAALGNFVQASLPYAESDTTTGPSSTGIASPAWPGQVVATLGSTIGTFVPTVPAPLVALLTYPAAAYSSYPARSSAGATGSFSPPAAGLAGVGTASTTSLPGLTTSKSAISDLAPLGASKAATDKKATTDSLLSAVVPALRTLLAPSLRATRYANALDAAPFIEVASASVSTTGVTKATTVSATGSTRIGRISLFGLIEIDGISSDASATSDGKTGKQTSGLNVGAVTVAGQSASIGPNGLTLNGKAPGGLPDLVSAANAVLEALQQIGLSISLIAPVHAENGGEASVTSGAVELTFQDNNLPNLGAVLPQLPLPLPSSLGLQITLGSSQADAAATALSSGPGLGTGSGATIGGTTTPDDTSITDPGTTPDSQALGPDVTPGTVAPGNETPVVASSSAAAVFGVPLQMAWVILAFVFSLFAAGGLLGYANWQLLRGRTP